jgi:3-oxoacyl-[acyl-carrier-protein] synthase-1
MKLMVTSIGMLTSVGRDAVTSCASHRAGITRLKDIVHYTVSESPVESVPLTGHQVPLFSEGFVQLGLWIRFAEECIRDLINYGKLPAGSDQLFWKKTGITAVVPLMDEDRFLLPTENITEILKECYLKPLLDLTELPIPLENARVVDLGHIGLMKAVVDTNELLSTGKLDRVLIVGVDSYLDPLSLDWLAEADALKTPQNSDGTIPGEAGACVMIESEAAAHSRHAKIDAYIERAALLNIAKYEILEPENIGADLARAVTSVLANENKNIRFCGDIYLDLNGEAWKAKSWGYAQTLLQGSIDFLGCRAVYPCSSFGEIGAASSIASNCLAVRAYTRNYALSNQSLICSINDNGHVGAMLVRKRDFSLKIRN